MTGALIPFPCRFVQPRDHRVDSLLLRARHHALVAEVLELEAGARAEGFLDEAAEIAPAVEEAAASLAEFERRSAGAGA